jgi:hypothetical protein
MYTGSPLAGQYSKKELIYADEFPGYGPGTENFWRQLGNPRNPLFMVEHLTSDEGGGVSGNCAKCGKPMTHHGVLRGEIICPGVFVVNEPHYQTYWITKNQLLQDWRKYEMCAPGYILKNFFDHYDWDSARLAIKKAMLDYYNERIGEPLKDEDHLLELETKAQKYDELMEVLGNIVGGKLDNFSRLGEPEERGAG